MLEKFLHLEGKDTPYIVPSGLAVIQQIYLEECVEKRLKPMIEKYYFGDDYVFWPDLITLC